MTHSGGKPHAVGDRGQRYEVTFLDPADNVRKVFGWSETDAGADSMVRSINAHPCWSEPKIIDRQSDANQA